MKKKFGAYELFKAMKPAARFRLALAVFLMFGILGPLTCLIDSKTHLLQWQFVIVQTIASGGFAASIIVVWGRKWYLNAFVIVFWSMVTVLNSGGIGLILDKSGSFRVQLNGIYSGPDTTSHRPLHLSAAEIDAIYEQRGFIGLLAIGMLAAGYASFISVIRNETRHRARLETEVTIARNIQESLLPAATVETSWCSVAGRAIPATEVGGDFFDVIQLSDHRIAVVVADVTGHGVGAGILSAMTKSALRNQLQHDPSPATVLANLNRTIREVSTSGMFVTFAYLLLDRKDGVARVATAGHPPVLCRKSAGAPAEEIRTKSVALGMKDGADYSEMSLPVAPGAAFILYTDGMVEAADAKGAQFGTDRLRHILDTSNGTAEFLLNDSVKALHDFTSGSPWQDDVTVVCVRI